MLHARPRRYRSRRPSVVVKRVQGGFMGLLSAIAAEWLDPEDGSTPAEDRFSPYSAADHRARDRREYRREKKADKRAPF